MMRVRMTSLGQGGKDFLVENKIDHIYNTSVLSTWYGKYRFEYIG